MNKTKIEWTDYSWNPITGCKHGCWYCYAKKLFTRFHRSFKPTFHPERLEEPLYVEKPSKIFVCSVADLFAEWTPVDWTQEVLDVIDDCDWHIFQLLTKNPERIGNYEFPDNVWVGTTITNQSEIKNIEEIKKVKAKVKFVSFEPILGEINADLKGIDWIIIGKLTGSRKIKLRRQWVDVIVNTTRALDIPIFMKNNLKPDYEGRIIQEFPSFPLPPQAKASGIRGENL